ncbi:hypothetical protein MFLO_05255 [Listeria floridensis FSL S10-1187]|uniref:Uncharacterized protein n=1 Tax=Listeria floridensis FSL S10-1187 TaxID=1265817 RepID=A0ABP3B0F2_9LIST|nr:hypothetical protein MFLO_05255 [Listeria floridensis FSL S10-1187]
MILKCAAPVSFAKIEPQRRKRIRLIGNFLFNINPQRCLAWCNIGRNVWKKTPEEICAFLYVMNQKGILGLIDETQQ